MKKCMWLRSICLCFLLLLPLISLPLMAFATPSVYTETFVGALDEKYERLCSIDEPKIVIVGGSSVAFGIDSALIEETMGMPVVNFGLYADLGTKLMMDLSRANINEGDIVILAPEIDEQTMSLYFNSDMTLHAVEDTPSMLLRLPMDNLLQSVGSLFDFTSQKLSYLSDGTISHGTGIYDSRYFNEYGDVDGSKDIDGDGNADFPRAANAMPAYYDVSRPIVLDTATVSEEFVEYVQQYKSFCERRGATFYYAFCPMNALALYYGAESMQAKAFETLLTDALGEDAILGKIKNHVFAPGYFFDSNFHLNSMGVIAHTVTLLDELILAQRNVTAMIPVAMPEPPELPMHSIAYEGEDDPNAQYFTFAFATEYSEALGFEVQLGYRITGLSELGKTQKTLTIPLNYDGYRVTLLGEDALAGGVCETLILPDGFNVFATDQSVQVFTFEENCLRGAGEQLSNLHIYIRNCGNLLPPTNNGAATPFVIHTPKDSDYSNGYFWSQVLGQFTIKDDLTP